MKKISCFFFSMLFIISIAKAQHTTIVKMEDLLQEIGQQDDTTRIVNFWATWCAPCVKEIPYFEEITEEYKNQKVKVILVGVEDFPEKIDKFIEKKGIKSTVWLLDEKDANTWIPQIDKAWEGEIPVTLGVNNARRKRIFHKGALDKKELINMIQTFLN